MLGKILIAFGALVLALAGGVGYLAYRTQQAPEMVAGLPAIVRSKDADAQLDRKIRDLEATIQEARHTGVRKHLALVVTQEELTTRAARLIEDDAFGTSSDNPASGRLRDVQVRVANDSIIASAKVEVQGIALPIAAQLKVGVSNGQPKVQIEKVDLGNVPLPQVLKDQINQEIVRKTDLSQLSLPVELTAVRIENGRVVIEGQSK